MGKERIMSEEKKQCDSKSCDKKSCEGCSHANGGGIPKEELNAYSDIKKVIGVVSGKGGVGKSFVTASLANEMASKGYRVGILDADITGPSIPRMYGIKGSATADDNGIYPILTKNDIKIMSINLLLPQEEAPVIWRGPILANMVKQFWTDVIWGELDYDCVPVSAGGRYCHCVISPGFGAYDCEKSLQHGQDDECAGDRSGGKLQLCKMS